MYILAPSLAGGSCCLTLRYLSLQGNRIRDDGISFFLQQWTISGHSSNLTTLDLSENRFTFASVLRLIDALPSLPVMSAAAHHDDRINAQANRARIIMEELNVSGSNINSHQAMIVDYDQLVLIGQSLARKKLRKFIIDRNTDVSIMSNAFADDDTSPEAVTHAAKRAQAGDAVLQCLRRNMYLESLPHVIGMFPHNVEAEMEFYLMANRRGRALLLEQNVLPLGIWNFFLAKQNDNAGLLFVILRELPILLMTYISP